MAPEIEIRDVAETAEEARVIAGYERNAPDHDFAFEHGQQHSQLLDTAGDVEPEIAVELERKRDRCYHILSLRRGPNPREQRNQTEYRVDGQAVGSAPAEGL
ncbi:hypothetical protein [Natronococcus jeotgali]|uniref:Uncharacterized protein n=1 Tax=Natronococcus jeotgali DSM 18795 TaxID=1227498 RepID=L9XAI0_9EURY|nr:hypothetical protein [Natronococcus jeotgali]ELY58725.1 hypothetical protein C492_11570 [Natronococcus jeotgali DSM 18795]